MNKIFKLPSFNRWMKKTRLSDQKLYAAVEEMAKGLIDADLGRNIVKKRVALPGYGKRGAARTLLATNRTKRWIFLYGFQKNERENISYKELEILQDLASDYLSFSDNELDLMVGSGKLLEVIYGEKE
jgi:hypothetical protein